MSKNTKTVIILLIIAVLIAIVPLFALKNAEFGGSDDAGSQMISEIQGEEYEPWFTPVLESALGGELPGEVESMIFCVQTGIGVGIIAFVLGRYVERRKWQKKEEKNNEKAGETEVSHA
ncbi:MAG: energy-coupling factor ABC transporter substrate-binding protein [Clostridiales bacterium]|uniref:Cobalt transport protein CbiN n=1 Tax=Candidatus Anaerobutyricum stercoripullorum TaxID=2838456 RepID=A0A9D1X6A3_9FIRM|nr:energy-coupling factor ABC transporter substrate-binding protein [Clostridiales bacterium]HIX73291.1 energy-coupling factor ABC transporter substrate-binding protein [Candidatus Anaerobutyricum stercoripullorum]